HHEARAAAADAGAFELEQALADGPALPFLADPVGLERDRIGEEGLAKGRGARNQLDRPRLDAGLVHVEDEEGDPFMVARPVGAEQAEAEIGPLPARSPGLLAVDDIMVALVLGEALQAREVGSRAGLRIALGAADRAVGERRQPFELLLV